MNAGPTRNEMAERMNADNCCTSTRVGSFLAVAFIAHGLRFLMSHYDYDATLPFLTDKGPLYLVGAGHFPYPFNQPDGLAEHETKVFNSPEFLKEYGEVTRAAVNRIYGPESIINHCSIMYQYHDPNTSAESFLTLDPNFLDTRIFRKTGILVGTDTFEEAKDIAKALEERYPFQGTSGFGFQATPIPVNVPTQLKRFEYSLDGLSEAATAIMSDISWRRSSLYFSEKHFRTIKSYNMISFGTTQHVSDPLAMGVIDVFYFEKDL